MYHTYIYLHYGWRWLRDQRSRVKTAGLRSIFRVAGKKARERVQTFGNSRPGKGFGGKTCIFNSHTPELSEFQKLPSLFMLLLPLFRRLRVVTSHLPFCESCWILNLWRHCWSFWKFTRPTAMQRCILQDSAVSWLAQVHPHVSGQSNSIQLYLKMP